MSRNGGRFLGMLVLFVSACATPFGLGGQDLGIEASAGTEAPLEGDFAAADSTCEEGTVAASLSATGGVGVIDVVHGFDGDCCAEWTMSAVVSEAEDWVIDLSYENAAAPCDCTCGWTLEYQIVDVAAGDWAVRIDGLEATTSVQ